MLGPCALGTFEKAEIQQRAQCPMKRRLGDVACQRVLSNLLRAHQLSGLIRQFMCRLKNVLFGPAQILQPYVALHLTQHVAKFKDGA